MKRRSAAELRAVESFAGEDETSEKTATAEKEANVFVNRLAASRRGVQHLKHTDSGSTTAGPLQKPTEPDFSTVEDE